MSSANLSLPPLSSLSNLVHTRSSWSSSPTRSSSPPLTPCSSGSTCQGAYIHNSSPTTALGLYSEESIFSRRYRQSYSDDVWRNHVAPPIYCKRDTSFLSKSSQFSDQSRDVSPETDDEYDNDDIFAPEKTRSTFFMVSAERGRWKTDPMPRKVQSQPRITTPDADFRSPVMSLQHPPTRSVSEPAPLQQPPSIAPTPHAHVQSASEEKPVDLQSPYTDSDHTLPSLTTDAESSHEEEEPLAPLSPLPPSSPRLSPLSPYSSPRPQSAPSPTGSPLLLSSPLSSPSSVILPLEDSMVSGRSQPTGVYGPGAPVKTVWGSMENITNTSKVTAKVVDKKKRKKEDQPDADVSTKRRRLGASTGKKGNNKATQYSAPCKGPEESTCPKRDSSQDEEIRGMLIESMALSRASSLSISSLYKALMQTRPALKSQKDEKEWSCVFSRVLEAGKEIGMFGKVESSGKDDRDRPLEPQWFYVPEMDEDQERAALIRSMMPRPGKRNETKKYKQYYYRPLRELSRWELEDSI